MRFLDLFNKIQKGNYALTDEAVYASLQNHDELVPLYGGNKSHVFTERYISVSAKTMNGAPITIFSGEGIIISLDGSAGSMTYKIGEHFALNHHAGFITLKDGAEYFVKLEFFAIYLQNFYRSLGVSDGSKTLSLERIYSEEFDLPSYSTQCRVLEKLKPVIGNLKMLLALKQDYLSMLEKEVSFEHLEFQAQNIGISQCIGYMGGNSGLTEEFIYHTLDNPNERYFVLSSATEERTMLGTVPDCEIGGKPLKIFNGKDGLLVTRNGKAGQTRFLENGKYAINDHAYILYVKEDSPYEIDLKWLAIRYRTQFLQYVSNADNGTWNMTGFFKYTKIDIPLFEYQIRIVEYYELLEKRIRIINNIEKEYQKILSKEIVDCA